MAEMKQEDASPVVHSTSGMCPPPEPSPGGLGSSALAQASLGEEQKAEKVRGGRRTHHPCSGGHRGAQGGVETAGLGERCLPPLPLGWLTLAKGRKGPRLSSAEACG